MAPVHRTGAFCLRVFGMPIPPMVTARDGRV